MHKDFKGARKYKRLTVYVSMVEKKIDGYEKEAQALKERADLAQARGDYSISVDLWNQYHAMHCIALELKELGRLLGVGNAPVY